MKKIGIIGAGFGGLSAAIRLADAGYDVTVLEKNSVTGGKASSLYSEGYRFDTGPSVVTMIDVIRELFESSGAVFDNYLDPAKLNILCKYFFSDKTVINAFSDTGLFAGELSEKTGENEINVKKYFEYTKKIYSLTSEIFLFSHKGFKSLFANPNAYKTLFRIKGIDSFRTMHQANSAFFKSGKIVNIFDRYATYNGSNPYKAPATLNLISHVENAMGAYFFKGGMNSLSDALYNLALEKGVKFLLNKEVRRINPGIKQIESLDTNDGKFTFDEYICNCDALTANAKLLGKGDTGIKQEMLSSSALVFYLGVKGIYKVLDTHNILFSSDYKNEFDEIFSERQIPSDPTVYIYISSKFNKKDAPENCENWFVMINVPSGIHISDDKIQRTKKMILGKIKNFTGIDVSEKIVTENILTPDKLELKTGSYKGSIYGYSSNTRFSAFLKQRNRSSEYRNLYFCGGTAHPGGGIPLAILSGKNVFNLICNK